MKADTSDAPQRVIQKRPKRRDVYNIVSLAVAAAVAFAAFQLISRAVSVDSLYNRSTNPAASALEPNRATNMPPSGDLGASRLQPSSLAAPPTDTPRQTVFNDHNFTPRGADNVVAFSKGADSPAPPPKQPAKQAKLTIVQQSSSMKDRVCWPYRQGSIERRNCRLSVGLKHRY
jgi:hypothetical protein